MLSDGWRQPGSSIKPIDYAIGIEDEVLTASTMFMDVVTDFGGKFTPTQADDLERGPVRLRSALQFSLNIPAIKATIMQGLDHTFERTQDFGLAYPDTATPVLSMGIGTLETHPIDMLSGYGTIANGGVRMPRQMIMKVVDEDGKQIWPLDDEKPEGVEVISPQAAYIITDILAGNTEMKTNPYWGEFAIYRKGVRRPAAYKTGTTSDNRDVHAYGYLAPPKDPDRPALAAGVWMGNSNNDPNKGSLSLDSSAPLWSALLEEVSAKYGISRFKAPGGLQTATVDAFTGLKPGPFTKKTVKELFLKGTVPTERETIRVSLTVDDASGLLWRDGCVGPKVAAWLLRPTRGGEQLPGLAEGQPQLGRSCSAGAWAPRGPRGHQDLLLLQQRIPSVRQLVGGAVRPAHEVPARPTTGCHLRSAGERSAQRPVHPGRRPMTPGGGGGGGDKPPKKTPKPPGG